MSPRLITRSPITLALNKKIKTWVNKSVALISDLKSASDKRTDNMSGKYSILETSQNRISIEVSPNNNFNAKLLGELDPHFISVTWLGAKYLQLPNHQIPTVVLAQNLNKLKCPVLVHLPGRNLKKERMLEILNLLKNIGIKHVLALQGDWVHVLEKDDTKVDFPYASDLVSFIKGNFGNEFCVGVTAYPDLHPHCEDLERDLHYLKKKISLGAEFILTQAVFDFDMLENYIKSCRRHGINVPIFVGVFIIKSYQSLKNMAKWCEFKVPQAVLEFLENNRDDPDAIERYGLDFGENLIRKILENKELFAGVHLYSMNDMEWMEKVLDKFKYSDDASSSAKIK